MAALDTVAYMLHARTVESQKQPFLINTRNNGTTVLCNSLEWPRSKGLYSHTGGQEASCKQQFGRTGNKLTFP
jgi:hypothetical protein